MHHAIPIRTVEATRYVTPLREGGSLPAIVEADDDGTYVAKFRGAGQGPRALVAELVAGEIARALGLHVPEIVFVVLDPELSRTEPDPEIQDLLQASGGLNLGLDYLPGSLCVDPAAGIPADPETCSAIVWFDALVTNIDRTARNTNLLLWHRTLYLIDHGAALYAHFDWSDPRAQGARPFPAIRNHVLLPYASALADVDPRLRARLADGAIPAIVAAIPDAWLPPAPGFESAADQKRAYVEYLEARLAASPSFVEEAARARALLV